MKLRINKSPKPHNSGTSEGLTLNDFDQSSKKPVTCQHIGNYYMRELYENRSEDEGKIARQVFLTTLLSVESHNTHTYT